MASRFQKRIKIAPGLRLNFGFGGVSLSAGPRGASVTVGKNGVYGNAGIPGTGLSYREKLSSKSSRDNQRINQINTEKDSHSRETLKIQLVLEENGAVSIKNEFGESLSRSEIQLFWKQQSDTVVTWLEEESNKINGDVNLLSDIYKDTLAPNSHPEYKIKTFEKISPAKLEPLPPLNFFKKLFKSNRIKHMNVQSSLLNEYNQQLLSWRNGKEIHDRHETAMKKFFAENIYNDIKLMDNTLQSAFNSLLWPRETLISYEITDAGALVWLDVDLPEIEDFPQKEAVLAVSGRKLNIKDKSQKKLREEYADHVHGIIFRLVGTVFATLPTPNQVIISGYSQRLDKATGKINDDYLFSFKVDRERFSNIDFLALDRVDPIESLAIYEHRRKMTSTGIFKIIEPYEINNS